MLHILLFGTLLSHAQTTDRYRFDLLGFEDGLSHREVFQVHQDNDGFLWMATINGLNRYDGYRIRSYDRTRLAGENCQSIAALPGEQLLIAHPNALTAFDPLRARGSRLDVDGQNFRTERATVAPNGSIWVLGVRASRPEVSYLLRRQSGGWLAVDSFPARRMPRPVVAFGEHVFVAGRANQLRSYAADGTPRPYHNFSFRGDHPGRAAIRHLYTEGNELYALLSDGTVRRRLRTHDEWRVHPVSQLLEARDSASLFVPLDDRRFLVGNATQLFALDLENQTRSELTSDIAALTRFTPTLRHLLRDRSGVVWVSTNFGAVKISRERRLFTTFLSGGDVNCRQGYCSMRGITSSPDGVVYASYYDGLHRIDPVENRVEPLLREGQSIQPFGLHYRAGFLYTGNGLRLRETGGRLDTLLPGPLVEEGVVIADGPNHLLFGAGKQLYRYAPPTGRLDSIPFDALLGAEDRITYLFRSPLDSVLWLATQQSGVFRLNQSENQIQQFGTENGLRSDRILVVDQTAPDAVWLGTADGLHCLDPGTGQVRAFTTADGLPNNFINGLLTEGDSILWVSTDNGLSRFDPRRNDFQNFTTADGLPANEFNRISFHKTATGRMIFGGLNGLETFYPQQLARRVANRRPYPMLFTGFSKLDGNTDTLYELTTGLDTVGRLELSHKDRFFTFDYALADFTDPRANLYRHRMEGLEEEWSVPVAEPRTQYSNLQPGNYVFRVQASPGGEYWNATELRVPVRVEQAFWKKRRFIVGMAVLLTLLVYAVQQFRLRQIRHNERQLEAEVQQRTRDLAAAKEQSDRLLLNILPESVAEELKTHGKASARRHERVSVLFCDFVGFSAIANQLSPEALVDTIDAYFRGFDAIVTRHQLTKIKTIGDAYMCASGMFRDDDRTAHRLVEAALEMQQFVAEKSREFGERAFTLRVGIHTGPVVAGVVGTQKFAYDIWGDTVNLAARMEQNGAAGRVNVSQTTYELVRNEFQGIKRGKIAVKNLGAVEMWFVQRIPART